MRGPWINDITKANYFSQVSLSNVNDSKRYYKFGRNDLVSSVESIVASGGIYGLPTTAEPLIVTSSSASDSANGSGARLIHIFGLDGDFNEVDEIVSIGQVTTKEFRRAFRLHVEEAGTTTPVGGGNAGTLSIKQSVSNIAMLSVLPNEGQTLCACYTVPNGYTALIWSADTSTGSGKTSTNRLKIREAHLNAPFRTSGIRDNYQNFVGQRFILPSILEEKTDIIFTSESESAGTSVSATFMIELIKN